MVRSSVPRTTNAAALATTVPTAEASPTPSRADRREAPHAAGQEEDQDDGLHPGRDRDRQGDARQPERPHEQDGERHVDDDRADRGEDRRERVLSRVERAGQHGDQRVRGEADEEREQRRRGQRQRGRAVAAVVEEERHDLDAERSRRAPRSGP